ncbi:hypothetical protein YA0089_26355 [Pseudomonas viridiflava]|uniref:hypothetical protein n=1 Tax=Pseudomonas viridiflava TaxID=33069 RepID=UPI0018E5E82F|nr:hypothetical protein [Pseudomonas viridiflava]MBI6727139.1 hypothetical protein [Pseudomonas viridiflava]
MRPILLEGHCSDSSRVEVRIEVSLSKVLPFVLECDTDYRGTRLHLALPRSYRTLAGAKIAAAKFVGDTLIWLEPAHKRESN